MKTNKLLNLIMSLVAFLALSSCVEDDDFTIPSSLADEENAALVALLETGTEVDMAFVQGLYTSGTAQLVTSNIYVKGYVSSSDVTGNFYKEFYMQDAPSAPTKTLKVVLNQTDSYNQFNKGRAVYIKLKGLYVGEERVGNGVYTIGGDIEYGAFGTTVAQLIDNQIKSNILRSTITKDIIPLPKTFSTIGSSNIGMLVSVDNVEFVNDLAGESYLETNETYDTQREMISCEADGYGSFQLETSSFASFKQEPLPVGNGTITAVVVKTYNGSQLVLALNSTDDVNFTNARCSPPDLTDSNIVFYEDFEASVDGTDLDLPGWTNFSEVGSRVWKEVFFEGNGLAEFGSFNSQDVENIAWLIAPNITTGSQNNMFFKFRSAHHHLESNDNTLEVYLSTDFDGIDVLGATWNPLNVTVPTTANNWYEFVDSGLIDISNYSGGFFIAFKVTGSGTELDLDGSYQIDDFKVFAN
ncbi:hypothetical protein ES676_06105 [Bizionia saleffrena]|uniref:DUF5689 domain-containing protein n=1 Tax=Bizionia saleffrena TaxID=291189 RepID=A0A8H2LEY5_9FLAO|nr:DUF5689 domain-containing protein [Bizionia saleffrena]TYB76022.1 hypothetical protein ES676_06105 [Bizionia saleffrena]